MHRKFAGFKDGGLYKELQRLLLVYLTPFLRVAGILVNSLVNLLVNLHFPTSGVSRVFLNILKFTQEAFRIFITLESGLSAVRILLKRHHILLQIFQEPGIRISCEIGVQKPERKMKIRVL